MMSNDLSEYYAYSEYVFAIRK